MRSCQQKEKCLKSKQDQGMSSLTENVSQHKGRTTLRLPRTITQPDIVDSDLPHGHHTVESRSLHLSVEKNTNYGYLPDYPDTDPYYGHSNMGQSQQTPKHEADHKTDITPFNAWDPEEKQIYGFNLPSSGRLRTAGDDSALRSRQNAQVKNRRSILSRTMSGSNTVVVSAGLLLKGFNEKTTSHGIPHVYFASGLIKKLIWGVISFVALVFLVLHLYLLIMTWKEAEVGTRINFKQQRVMTFPAVTVCNYNTIKASNLRRDNTSAIYALVESATANKAASPRQRTKVRNELLNTLIYEYAALNDSQFSELGHDAEDFALFCSFGGEPCDEGDFYYFRDNRFGNCVTLNSGRKPDNYNETSKYPGGLRHSSVAGPEYGLSFVVYVEAFEYIPIITEAVGAQIVIHNQTVMPFPGQGAVSVQANSLVNIGLKKSEIERLSGRFGNCTSSLNNSDNIYHEIHQVDYSLTACLKTCLQREVIQRCHCYDPGVPFQDNSPVFPHAKHPPLCNSTDDGTTECLSEVNDMYEDGSISCEYCHSPCKEAIFGTSVSSASWPAKSYLRDFINSLEAEYPRVVRRMENRAASHFRNPERNQDEIKALVEEMVSENFLQVNVYYEAMELSHHQEISIYDDYQFASDLGGSFGLWVGWSIISMIEFVELAVDMLVYLLYSRCGVSAGNDKNNKQTLSI